MRLTKTLPPENVLIEKLNEVKTLLSSAYGKLFYLTVDGTIGTQGYEGNSDGVLLHCTELMNNITYMFQELELRKRNKTEKVCTCRIFESLENKEELLIEINDTCPIHIAQNDTKIIMLHEAWRRR
jgi:hypothetical protein